MMATTAGRRARRGGEPDASSEGEREAGGWGAHAQISTDFELRGGRRPKRMDLKRLRSFCRTCLTGRGVETTGEVLR